MKISKHSRPSNVKISNCQSLHYDPERRLLAAVVLRAVRDYLFPPKQLLYTDWADARRFVLSPDGCFLLALFLGVEEQKVEAALLEIDNER